MKLTITNEYEITSYDGSCEIDYANNLEFNIYYNVTPGMPSPARSFVRFTLTEHKEILEMLARELYNYIENKLPETKKGRNKPHGVLEEDFFYICALNRWQIRVEYATKPNLVLPSEAEFTKAFLEGVGYSE